MDQVDPNQHRFMRVLEEGLVVFNGCLLVELLTAVRTVLSITTLLPCSSWTIRPSNGHGRYAYSRSPSSCPSPPPDTDRSRSLGRSRSLLGGFCDSSGCCWSSTTQGRCFCREPRGNRFLSLLLREHWLNWSALLLPFWLPAAGSASTSYCSSSWRHKQPRWPAIWRESLLTQPEQSKGCWNWIPGCTKWWDWHYYYWHSKR